MEPAVIKNDHSLFFLLDLASDVSWFIGEPLALHAEKGRIGTYAVIYTERDAVVIAELELGQIAVQMLLIATLVDALHATLEQAEVTFNSVGVDRSVLKRDVLTDAVVDSVVAGKLFAYLGVVLGLVGHQPRLTGDVLADDAADLFAGHCLDVNG